LLLCFPVPEEAILVVFKAFQAPFLQGLPFKGLACFINKLHQKARISSYLGYISHLVRFVSFDLE
jgi:hypothetical protein